MGVTTLPRICAELIAHGLPADWPAALIEDGTQPSQRVLTGSLADLPAKVAAQAPRGASLLIVGEVVRLRERLDWFRAGATSGGAEDLP